MKRDNSWNRDTCNLQISEQKKKIQKKRDRKKERSAKKRMSKNMDTKIYEEETTKDLIERLAKTICFLKTRTKQTHTQTKMKKRRRKNKSKKDGGKKEESTKKF